MTIIYKSYDKYLYKMIIIKSVKLKTVSVSINEKVNGEVIQKTHIN